MFSRATITLGIGPHSSFFGFFLFVLTVTVAYGECDAAYHSQQRWDAECH